MKFHNTQRSKQEFIEGTIVDLLINHGKAIVIGAVSVACVGAFLLVVNLVYAGAKIHAQEQQSVQYATVETHVSNTPTDGEIMVWETKCKQAIARYEFFQRAGDVNGMQEAQNAIRRLIAEGP